MSSITFDPAYPTTDPDTIDPVTGRPIQPGTYLFTLNKTEYATLCWLSDRGYDANLWHYLQIDTVDIMVDSSTGAEIITGNDLDVDQAEHFLCSLAAYHARPFLNNIDDDPHAFLTCNGSASLAEKIHDLVAACETRNP